MRLQELFGLRETPSVAGRKLPLVLKLLSPAGRPVQITSVSGELSESGDHEAKKDLKSAHTPNTIGRTTPIPPKPHAAPSRAKISAHAFHCLICGSIELALFQRGGGRCGHRRIDGPGCGRALRRFGVEVPA